MNSFQNNYYFDFEKYKNYLINKDKEKKDEIIKEKNEVIDNKRKTNKENNINYINNYNYLEYLKENIFYVYENRIIKFYEFKNFSFNTIFSYDLGTFRIKNVKSAKYDNNILINFEFKKNIKFLEYDLINKTIHLSKKEIKDQKLGFPRFFSKYFDNKNGDILTQDRMGATIWKKGPKNSFNKFTTINEA